MLMAEGEKILSNILAEVKWFAICLLQQILCLWAEHYILITYSLREDLKCIFTQK